MNHMKKLLIFLLCSAFAFAQKDLSSAEKFQVELNKSFADSLKSPLTKEDFKQFKGLDFFYINEKLSHIGTNSFTLLLENNPETSRWKIVHIIDTRRKK